MKKGNIYGFRRALQCSTYRFIIRISVLYVMLYTWGFLAFIYYCVQIKRLNEVVKNKFNKLHLINKWKRMYLCPEFSFTATLRLLKVVNQFKSSVPQPSRFARFECACYKSNDKKRFSESTVKIRFNSCDYVRIVRMVGGTSLIQAAAILDVPLRSVRIFIFFCA